MTALKVLEQYHENIISFGKEPVNESIMVAAEKFLAKCIDAKSNATTFGQLCLSYCLSKGFKFNVEKYHPYYQASKSIYAEPFCKRKSSKYIC